MRSFSDALAEAQAQWSDAIDALVRARGAFVLASAPLGEALDALEWLDDNLNESGSPVVADRVDTIRRALASVPTLLPEGARWMDGPPPWDDFLDGWVCGARYQDTSVCDDGDYVHVFVDADGLHIETESNEGEVMVPMAPGLARIDVVRAVLACAEGK